MQRAGSGDPARQNLSALRNELLQRLHILEIDVFDLLDAELADALAAIEELLLAALLSTRASTAALFAAALAGASRLCHCHRRSPLLARRQLGLGGGSRRSLGRSRECRSGTDALFLRIALRELLRALMIEVSAHDHVAQDA